MVDIRSRRWREESGISYDQAEHRIDEASRVIGSSGFLHPVRILLDGGVFRDVFRETKIIKPGTQPGVYQMEPDYVGFLGFAYAAIEYVGTRYPDADKLDFVVERKSGVTHHIVDFVDSLADVLTHKGKKHLVHLIGDVIPGGKEHVGLQAADVAVWHWRRHEIGSLEPADKHRLYRLFKLRQITANGMTKEEIEGMGLRSRLNRVQSPFKAKPKDKNGFGDGNT